MTFIPIWKTVGPLELVEAPVSGFCDPVTTISVVAVVALLFNDVVVIIDFVVVVDLSVTLPVVVVDTVVLSVVVTGTTN